MGKIYRQVLEFKRKYPITIGWRLKKNAAIVEMHMNPGEEPLYSFFGQKNDNSIDIFSTAVVTLTNKRILIGRKRVLFGYFLNSITPDLFNDLKIRKGLIWSDVEIDTIRENVYLSNINPEGAIEAETNITEFMMKEKKKYKEPETNTGGKYARKFKKSS